MVSTSMSVFRCLCFAVLVPCIAVAQTVPPSVDSGRVGERVQPLLPPPMLTVTPEMRPSPMNPPPEASKEVVLMLRGVTIEGMTAFTPEQVRDLYAPYLNKEITLDVMWTVASQLRERYQQAGYVLSRAYVPAQEIGAEGTIHLKVVEGYISTVVFDEKARVNTQVTQWVQHITKVRPLKIEELESLLLRLNDLPGQSYRAILEKPTDKAAPEGAAQLNIITQPEPIQARVTADNYGSRFLGPYEVSAQAAMQTFTNQKTSVAFLNSTQTSELTYGSLRQDIPLAYGWAMDLSASRADTQPGYTLSPQGIDGTSTSYGLGFTRQWVRQREENFSTRLAFDGRDTTSDLLDGQARLTRDHIRALRLGGDYQVADRLGGVNLGSVTLSQGIGLLGASEKGDADLSRAAATPDFTKAELSYTRLQAVGEQWQAVGAVAGQIASGPLYSAEEFGYGGQAFGRAYDASEITGDQGIAASIELRYQGFSPWQGMEVVPYGFYDIGRVWNEDAGQDKTASGSSAGAGVRFASELGISANLGVALPLTRDIATPLYGKGNEVRYLLQVSYDLYGVTLR